MSVYPQDVATASDLLGAAYKRLYQHKKPPHSHKTQPDRQPSQAR